MSSVVLDGRPPPRTRAPLYAFLATALVCTAGSLLEHFLAPLHGGIAPVKPTAGIALAAVLLGGHRMLPATFAGSFLAALLGSPPLPASLMLGIDTAACAALGAFLLQRLPTFQPALPRLSDVLALAGRGAITATLPGASLAWLAAGGGPTPVDPAPFAASHWIRHWIADALGVLLFAPALLAWIGARRAPVSRQRLLSGLLPGSATAAFGAGLFLCPAAEQAWVGPMLVLIFPLLAWTGLRFSVRGTALVLLVLAVLAIASVAAGTGPYQTTAEGLSGSALSAFLFAAALTTLVLSGAHGELRVAMEARRSSEELLRAVFDQANVGLSLMDTSLRRIMVNHRFAAMLGYEERELLGAPPGIVAPPEERAAVTRRLADVLEGRTPAYKIERRFVRRDGSFVWGELSVSRVIHTNGSPALLTIVHDVTDRRRTEDALRESEERFRAAFEQAAVGMALRALDGRWLRVNAKLCELLGYEREELLQLTSVDLTPPEDRWLAIENNERMARGEVSEVSREKRYLRKDGSIVWAHLSIGVVRASDGTVLHQLSCIHDITARKHAEAELHALNADLERRVAERTAALEASNRELESFSHSVAHDLRAPLRAMDGFSRLLLEGSGGPLEPDGRHQLERIRSASQRMAELIDALLLLARITRSEIRHSPVNLTEIAKGCVAELAAREPQRKVNVTIEQDLFVQGDHTLLTLALDNLLENAWKFTSRIDDARIEVARTAARGGQPAFVVRDNGSGFDMQYADKLFGPFQRLHHASEFPGTGIGLATVKRILDRHGGEVWARAKPGEGAEFFFSLPE